MRYLVVLVALIACGDDGAASDAGPSDTVPNHADEHAHDGTRLKIVWFHLADDTWQPTIEQFWDSQKHEYCSPEVWVDGVLRCTPRSPSGQVVYADSACTDPRGRIAYHGDTIGGPVDHFVTRRWVGDELRVVAVHNGSAGNPMWVSNVYELGPDGVCYEVPKEPYGYFGISAPLGDFATMYLDDFAPQQVVPIRLTSDDGMSVEVGMRDRDARIRCSLVPRGDGLSADCLLGAAALTTTYGDSQCLERVTVASSTTTVLPVLSAISGSMYASGCITYVSTTYARYAPRSPTSLYTRVASGCAGAFNEGFVFTQQQPRSIAQVTWTLENVPGRRYQHIVVGAGALSTIAETLFDTQLGTECAIGYSGQCMPITPSMTPLCP